MSGTDFESYTEIITSYLVNDTKDLEFAYPNCHLGGGLSNVSLFGGLVCSVHERIQHRNTLILKVFHRYTLHLVLYKF